MGDVKDLDRISRIYEHPDFMSRLQSIEEAEKDRKFCRHGLAHLLDVARLMYIDALKDGYISSGALSREMIYAAAMLHDIGRAEQNAFGTPHHEASAEISRVIMPACGFDEEETSRVEAAILAHRGREEGQSDDRKTDDVLGRLLYKADKASRQCYACDARLACNWPPERMNMKVGL